MRCSGVMIGTDDPARLGEFYTRVIGEPGFHDGEWYGWDTGAHMMIGPHSEVHGANAEPARIMVMVEADDVAAAFDALRALGAPEVAAPHQPDGAPDVWLATVLDPDGNYIQLQSPWT